MKKMDYYVRNYTLLCIIFFLFSIALQAQTNSVIDDIAPGEYNSDWQPYKSLELVVIFYKYSNCSDPANGLYPEQILFKVVNKTEHKVYAYWDYMLEYNNNPSSPSPDENLVQVTLDPKQSMEGSCTNLHQTKLGIFYRYIDDETVLTGFRFDNLSEHKLD